MHSTSIQKVLVGAGIFAGSTIIAVIGYWASGWSLLDAIYMVIITIYGVGYGEVRPVDEPSLKIFTICVIIAGCTSAIYVLGGFVQMIAEGELNRLLGARRMTKGIEKLSGHVIVCGFGRVGRILTEELSIANQPFVTIDTNEDRLSEAEQAGMFVILGDATEDKTLELAGIKRARLLATVLPDDTANVFITLTARGLNPDVEIIARGESPATETKLTRSGADRVVLPAAIGASRIARLITRPSAEKLLSAEGDHSVLNEDLKQIGLAIRELPVAADSSSVGCSLSQITFDSAHQSLIVAVRHEDATVTQNPPDEYLIRQNDVIILMASVSAIPQLHRTVKGSPLVYRGVRGRSASA